MGGALTEEYIQSAPKPVTSIAWYDKTPDEWVILILDKKGQIKHTKGHKEIIPVSTEEELLAAGVTPGYVRLSIGIEHPDDIIADLDQALGASGKPSLKAVS